MPVPAAEVAGSGRRPRRRQRRRTGDPEPGGPPESEPASGDNVRPDRVGEGGVSDPVRMYLKEIGKVPLLTGAQEVSLAQRIEQGLLASEEIDAANGGLSPEDKDRLGDHRSSTGTGPSAS